VMDEVSVAAVVLAAGRSQRMGRPKLTLPWGRTTVIGQVVSTLRQAGVEEIVAVTGGDRAAVEAALRGLPVRTVFNPRYADGEMSRSVQVGLRALPSEVEAALIVLGDHPQMQAEVVRAVVAAWQRTKALLVFPSYAQRRGHPWILGRSLWPEALALRPPLTLRDLVAAHAADAEYVPVDTDSVLRDLDTPEDYRRERPSASEEAPL